MGLLSAKYGIHTKPCKFGAKNLSDAFFTIAYRIPGKVVNK